MSKYEFNNLSCFSNSEVVNIFYESMKEFNILYVQGLRTSGMIHVGEFDGARNSLLLRILTLRYMFTHEWMNVGPYLVGA